MELWLLIKFVKMTQKVTISSHILEEENQRILWHNVQSIDSQQSFFVLNNINSRVDPETHKKKIKSIKIYTDIFPNLFEKYKKKDQKKILHTLDRRQLLILLWVSL